MTCVQGGSPLNLDPFFYLWCMSQGKMTTSGNSLNELSLPLVSLVYFARHNPIKEKANWPQAAFLLSLAKKSITAQRNCSDCLASGQISILTGFAGHKRIDTNVLNSILILFICSKFATTLRSHIIVNREGWHGNCFVRILPLFPLYSAVFRSAELTHSPRQTWVTETKQIGPHLLTVRVSQVKFRVTLLGGKPLKQVCVAYNVEMLRES